MNKNINFRRGNINLILGGVLAIAAMAVGGFFLWQKSQNATIDGNHATQPISEDEKKKIQPLLDSSAWKTLRNKHGWTIKSPPDWKVFSPSAPPTPVEPEYGIGVVFQGPDGCFDSGLRCGFLTVFFDSKNFEDPLMTPKKFLLESSSFVGGNRKLLAQKKVKIAGIDGYEITYLQTNLYGHPNGQVEKRIALLHDDRMFTIYYYEDYSDRLIIKSTDDWKLVPVFDTMLSTFRFL